MAPLPPNSTSRCWVKYSDGVNEHELMSRFDSNVLSVSDALQFSGDFFEAISDSLYLITIIEARWAEEGSNISLPVTWPAEPTYGDSTMPTVRAPLELRWVGRDQNGKRTSFSVWGGDFSVPDNYRIISSGANLPNLGVIQINTASAAGAMLTISGLRPTMKNYVNVNYNSYWETEARP